MTAPDQRELWLALAMASALIFLRSAVFIAFEQSFFDSDQAIIGLMAKHLVEGRAFPLFYYGQNYMLGVDAWFAAPVFAVAGASVATLHVSMALFNVLVGTLLILAFQASGGLRPRLAVLAASFFLFAPPFTTASLIEAGANIGPFAYVAALWLLRERPIVSGAILGMGFLNREFTIYALPMLLAADLLQGRLFTTERLRFWLVMAVATLATWQAIQALKPYADMMGPGTRGQLVGGVAGSQIGNIADRIAVVPSELPARATAMVGNHLARLYGTIALQDPIGPQGRDWIFWPFLAFMGLALARAVFVGLRTRTLGRAAFAFYLIGVGASAAAGVVLTRPIGMVVDRYVLLGLFIPIGIVGAYFALETRVVGRRLAMVAMTVWLAGSAVDHWHQAVRYVRAPETDELRDLINGMLARDLHVAEAGYWRAYKIAFLSGERIKVASTDVIRIEEYQALAAAAGPRLVTLQESPCGDAEKVSLWYLCRH